MNKPKDINNITEHDFYRVFEGASKNRLVPLPWIEFVSRVGMTLGEAEELSLKSKEWARLIKYYKEACQSTLLIGIKGDSKAAMDYYKSEYISSEEEDLDK